MNKALLEGLLAIENVANEVSCEREDVNRGILLALLTGNHCFLFGPPGTAKSMTARLFMSGLTDCRLFHKQLTRQMPEEAVFGPLDIPRWRKEGEYIYRTKGGLAEAHVGLLEEYFDASDALIRSMNELLNEREFSRSLSNVLKCPLHSCIATSNFWRSEGDAQAVSDRFLIRIQVESLEESKNRIRMLKNSLEHGLRPEIDDDSRVSFEDLAAAAIEVAEVTIPDDVLEMYEKVFADYKSRSQGRFLSDRRFTWSMRLIQAAAYLEGRNTCALEDIENAKYGLVFVGKEVEETAWSEAVSSTMKFVEDFENVKTFQKFVATAKKKVGTTPAKDLPAMHQKLMQIRDGLADRSSSTNAEVNEQYATLSVEIDAIIQDCVNRIKPDTVAAL